MPRNTQTVLYDADGNNRTAIHLSTNIIILVDGNTLGAVQKIDISEGRPSIFMLDEVGTDGHIDSAPNKSADVKGSVTRIRYDGIRMLQAFSRGYIHGKSQRVPFDIEIHDFFQSANEGSEIVTVIKNVWFGILNYSYASDNFQINETVPWEAEDIYSVIKTNSNVVTSPGNGMPNEIYLNTYEQQADRGVYRGSLDASGLLDAFLSDPTS